MSRSERPHHLNGVWLSKDLPLNIEVTRSGGFAGISRSFSAPEEELPADLRQPLQSLLAAGTPAAAASSARGADRFVYTIKHGGQEVTVGEHALDPETKRLVQWVVNRGG